MSILKLLKSQTQMVLNARALVLLHILVWSLPDTFGQSSGTLSDISCLKSIRDSLEDPLNHIATSWTFNSTTEDSFCRYVGVICGYTFENRVRGVKLANMGLKGKFPSGLVDCSELISLDLSGNVISGSIPHDINEILPNLEVLELSNNNLSGEIPSSMGDCFTLKVAKLNNNRLSGQIPQQLSENLEVLELSNNKLSGEIPSSMGHCSNLEVVKLNNNRLSGQIPQQLSELHRLIIFSVANNLLSGPVPDFIFVRTDTITPESYVNNSGLCGEPLDGCKHRWAFFELSFRSGFVVAFSVFASSYTAFFTYYFNLWGRSKKRKQMMPTKTTVLNECRKNEGKQIDQFIQLPTKALYKEESIQVPFLPIFKF